MNDTDEPGSGGLTTALRSALSRQADVVRTPLPDLGDVSCRSRRRRRTTALSAAAVAAVVALVGGLTALAIRDPDRQTAVASPVGDPPGILLSPTQPPATAEHGTIERVDRSAAASGWSLVVRAADGDFGVHSAVVTFPVANMAYGGHTVRIGDVEGVVTERTITWPLGSGVAEIIGDLPEAQLVVVAAGVREDGAGLAVDPGPGLHLEYSGPARGRITREARYGADEFGAAPVLGNGLVFADTVTGTAIERLVLASPPLRQNLQVLGHRAAEYGEVGNGGVAWQVDPGTYAFVGWSGYQVGDEQIAAIVAIADGARFVSEDEWQLTLPQTVENTPTTP
jgi:hypothetical protein